MHISVNPKKLIAITMPVYNEEAGIAEFISEIYSFLNTYNVVFIVVNDCSTDGTVLCVTELSQTGIEIILDSNEFNLGHGLSTRKGLERALEIQPDCILSVDGDGQFLGSEIADLVNLFFDNSDCVVEGVRQNRMEPYYRKVVTQFTRLLVTSRTFKLVKDANTPLRVYSPMLLQEILTKVPSHVMTPNLFISVVSRTMNIRIIEQGVKSLSRRGQTSDGVTWGKTRKNVPPKRYVLFCLRAIRQWASLYFTSLKIRR